MTRNVWFIFLPVKSVKNNMLVKQQINLGTVGIIIKLATKRQLITRPIHKCFSSTFLG